MDWWQAVAQWVVRPRVLHRLPGRLRVHLPFLKGAYACDGPLAGLVQRLLAIPNEIQGVSASSATGNAVIEYDASAVTEREVLEYLKHALNLCMKHREQLAALGPEGVLAAGDRLEEFVKRGVRQGLRLDPELGIPDDLLA